jgi:adenine-specific DNA-methyltransferase
MRYIGSKTKLLQQISNFIQENVRDKSESFCDLFSGTGAVAKHFKSDYQVIANDNLYFSFILHYVSVQLNELPLFEGLKENGISNPIDYLNNNPIDIDLDKAFVYLNYSPAGPKNRMYFSEENALRIDFIRQTLIIWLESKSINQNEYYFLLSALLEAVPYVSNTTGTYGAYLKNWDKRALKNIKIESPTLVNNNKVNRSFNCDSNDLINKISGDILYIDPPYNTRQYLSNYHVLETIALYDYPDLKGITGTRSDTTTNSKYSSKSKVIEAFDDLISSAKFKHIIVSYSSQGIMSKEIIENILKSHGVVSSFVFKSITYRKYKSKISTNSDLYEYLFYIRKILND